MSRHAKDSGLFLELLTIAGEFDRVWVHVLILMTEHADWLFELLTTTSDSDPF